MYIEQGSLCDKSIILICDLTFFFYNLEKTYFEKKICSNEYKLNEEILIILCTV